MASPLEFDRSARPIRDWLRPHLRWILLPSWLLSVLAHAALLFLALTLSQLKSCQPDTGGDAGESLREVGLIVESSSDTTPMTSPADVEATDVVFPTATTQSLVTPEAVPESPPANLSLPAASPPSIIGTGGPPPAASHGLLDPLVHPGRASSSATEGTRSGQGGTSFLGIGDVGKRFVYIIDRSFSMEDYGAFRMAKAELVASLERLDETQEFQVIFYNHDRPLLLKPTGGRFDMFWATSTQRADARHQIEAVPAQGGTNHLPAILQALKFNPEVVYLLTDGADPPLSAADLDNIKRHNPGARIHCIEFGEGVQPTDPTGRNPGNFLQKMATQNNGQYVYRDVTQFQRRGPAP